MSHRNRAPCGRRGWGWGHAAARQDCQATATASISALSTLPGAPRDLPGLPIRRAINHNAAATVTRRSSAADAGTARPEETCSTEHRRFDALARALAALLDRRQTLGAFLALLVALMVARDDLLAKKKGGKKGKGGKGGGKKGKGKNKKKKRRGGGGGSPRDCTEIALEPRADLRGCNLRERTDFPNANLTDADISDADLSGIDATGANFQGARFWRSRFNDATLEDVEFGASNARTTDLFGVDFSGANLDGAQDLDEALYVFRPEEMSDPGSSWYVTFCGTIMPDGSTNDEDC